MKEKSVLEMRGIYKSFPGVRALQNVDFTKNYILRAKVKAENVTVSGNLPIREDTDLRS